MWNYMKGIKDRFHIFVALNNDVHGNKSYHALMSKLQAESLTPSQQILICSREATSLGWAC
jgi:hypothetical protein